MAPELPGLKAYQRVQVESMQPGELIVAAYDVAIQACEKRDVQRAAAAVYELMNGLDFTYTDVAGQLVVMYDWIYRQIREGELEEAQRFLVELRSAWAEIIQANESAPSEISNGMDAVG